MRVTFRSVRTFSRWATAVMLCAATVACGQTMDDALSQPCRVKLRPLPAGWSRSTCVASTRSRPT